MAGMKRFVTYIYSYEDGKKNGNAGFAKVEIRGEDCRIEVHLREIYTAGNMCKVYLLREDAGQIVGFLLGEMQVLNGACDFGTREKAKEISDSPYGIFDMDGLVIIGEDKRMFLSRWKDDAAFEATFENFRQWTPPQNQIGDIKHTNEKMTNILSRTEESTPLENINTEKTTANVLSGPERTAAVKNMNTEKTTANVLSGPERTAAVKNMNTEKTTANVLSEPESAVPMKNMNTWEDIAATEVPMKNMFPDYDWHTSWEKLTEVHPVFAPFYEEKTICIQIELRELRELPRRYWYLGNNSFLLHGFFNYKYLIVGKTKEERWFIGVPGIYQRQERVMAAIFGFPEFMETVISGTRKSGEIDLQQCKDERELINRFGCWCRYIEE